MLGARRVARRSHASVQSHAWPLVYPRLPLFKGSWLDQRRRIDSTGSASSAPRPLPSYVACGLGGRWPRAVSSGSLPLVGRSEAGGRREPGPLLPTPSPPWPSGATCPDWSPVHQASLALAFHGCANPISPSLSPQAWGAGVFPVWLLSTLLLPLTSGTGTAHAYLLLSPRT